MGRLITHQTFWCPKKTFQGVARVQTRFTPCVGLSEVERGDSKLDRKRHASLKLEPWKRVASARLFSVRTDDRPSRESYLLGRSSELDHVRFCVSWLEWEVADEADDVLGESLRASSIGAEL